MTSKNTADAPRSYIVLSKAWYGGEAVMKNRTTGAGGVPVVEEVWITVDDGKVFGEFGLEWLVFQCIPTAMLRAFCDSWAAMRSIPGLLDALAEIGENDPSPDDICTMLDRLGFVDTTPTEQD